MDFENQNYTPDGQNSESAQQNENFGQNNERSYSFYQPNSPYIPPYTPKPPKNKKKNGFSKGGAAALIAVCLVLSCIVGTVSGLLVAKNAGAFQHEETISTISKSDSKKQHETVESTVSQGDKLTVKQIASQNQDAVVEIMTATTTRGFFAQSITTEGAGSGVIITNDGYIATNYHVIEDVTSISVRLHNGNEYKATVRGYDETTDIAVLKIEATELSTVTIGESKNLSVGDLVVAIGNPLGYLGGTVTDGIVSALEREITFDDGKTMTLMQTNTAINPGNSGGGLFNEYGELIGIVNAKTSDVGIEGLGFAIPIDTAYPVILNLVEFGYVRGRFTLGVQLIDIMSAMYARYYNVSDLGSYISVVNPGSNAEKAGLKSGDYIVSVNGKTITKSDEVKEIIDASSLGDVLNFVIKRNGRQMNIAVTLNEDTNNTALQF
ncbi:MAG: trypsin-like peptidase domain-containing protein [Clostridia bacterium]|nr:trypsin-like peptidase domain-containing protein [Clostridia bacterium]